jgi:hypothetical protein
MPTLAQQSKAGFPPLSTTLTQTKDYPLKNLDHLGYTSLNTASATTNLPLTSNNERSNPFPQNTILPAGEYLRFYDLMDRCAPSKTNTFSYLSQYQSVWLTWLQQLGINGILYQIAWKRGIMEEEKT